MLRLYISGPMRGLPDYNYAQFEEVEYALSMCTDDIFYAAAIVNPAKNFDGATDLPVAQYMQRDIELVLSVDALVLLPGWEKSEGAKLETAVAKATGKRFFLATPLDTGHWAFPELDEPVSAESARGSVLDEAKSLITGDRNNAYGPPTQDFRRSADALTAYGYRHTQLAASDPPCQTCGAKPLAAHDTAIAIDCVKTSRLMWTPAKRDSWVDKAGYAGCGYEAAINEQ